MFERSLDVLKELDRRGALEPQNAKWADVLTRQIATCDAALRGGATL